MTLFPVCIWQKDQVVINVAILSAIRRWYFHVGDSIQAIARKSVLSKNIVRKYLKNRVVEPLYRARNSFSKFSSFELKLKQDSPANKRNRRSLVVNIAGSICRGTTRFHGTTQYLWCIRGANQRCTLTCPFTSKSNILPSIQ